MKRLFVGGLGYGDRGESLKRRRPNRLGRLGSSTSMNSEPQRKENQEMESKTGKAAGQGESLKSRRGTIIATVRDSTKISMLSPRTAVPQYTTPVPVTSGRATIGGLAGGRAASSLRLAGHGWCMDRSEKALEKVGIGQASQDSHSGEKRAVETWSAGTVEFSRSWPRPP